MAGKFITLEGSEGSGKSTHAKLLGNYLKMNDIPFIHTREPGGTKIGEMIREILLNPANYSIVDKCELLLYLASRIQLVSEIIKPALSNDTLVISDRFTDATLAYQGYGSKLDLNLIGKLNDFVTEDIKPDLTILLDVDIKEGLKRNIKTKWPDRIEARAIGYHQRVRKGYLELAKKYPQRIKVIKVKEDINKTQAKVRAIVDQVCLSDKLSDRKKQLKV